MDKPFWESKRTTKKYLSFPIVIFTSNNSSCGTAYTNLTCRLMAFRWNVQEKSIQFFQRPYRQYILMGQDLIYRRSAICIFRGDKFPEMVCWAFQLPKRTHAKKNRMFFKRPLVYGVILWNSYPLFFWISKSKG